MKQPVPETPAPRMSLASVRPVRGHRPRLQGKRPERRGAMSWQSLRQSEVTTHSTVLPLHPAQVASRRRAAASELNGQTAPQPIPVVALEIQRITALIVKLCFESINFLKVFVISYMIDGLRGFACVNVTEFVAGS